MKLWSLKRFVKTIEGTLDYKFDCFIVIEGNRGLGKSTLAIHIARRVAKEMKKKGLDKYKFSWNNSLLYSQKEVINFIHKWFVNGIADEMINVTFNRDFFSQGQKDVIKMMNMNRDHGNLLTACVPQFQTLDSQIKNLCKIRLTVVRRGLAIVQTPNRTVYAKDKWDQATNEKIEREWLKKGITRPKYSKLTTFRGLLHFPPLSEKQEKKYQEIKDKKRNVIAKEQMGIEEEEEENPTNMALRMLKEGKIRNNVYLEGFAVAHGEKPSSFKEKLKRELKKEGRSHYLQDYFWEKKKTKKKKEKTEKEKQEEYALQ